MKTFIVLLVVMAQSSYAKEIALSFDDAPIDSTVIFESQARTDELIRKLKELKAPAVAIFANPCRRNQSIEVIQQLRKYKDAGHLIANHSCSHVRLDSVGYENFVKDVLQADTLLTPLYSGQKIFRFPFGNESKDQKRRDQMRAWLKKHKYKNGAASVDSEDYVFSQALDDAKKQDKKIDLAKIEKLFAEHIVESANYYDGLAVKTLGRSPKHVLLLHEGDATALFIEATVKALRKDGWEIISAGEAFQDKIYSEQPKNLYTNAGIIAQLSKEKTGQENGFDGFKKFRAELKGIVGL